VQLRAYLDALRAFWWQVLLIGVVGAGAGYGISKAQTPTFEASAKLFVSIAGGGSNANDLLQGSNFTQQQVKSYAEVATSRAVLDRVATSLRYRGGADALAEHVTASAPLDTVIIQVVATDTDPRRAAEISNSVSGVFAQLVSTLEPRSRDGASSVRASIIQRAQPATSAKTPRTKLNVGVGAIAGLLLAWACAAAVRQLDTRLKRVGDFEAFGDWPVLGVLPVVNTPRGTGVASADGESGRRTAWDLSAEAYRQLRTNLRFVDAAQPARKLLVTSSLPGEGKTTVASNLAIALAEAGSSVVLVDADLRRPAAARYLGLRGTPGLSGVLAETDELDVSLQSYPGAANLSVLPAGYPVPNASELLASDRLAATLDVLAQRFEFVVVDSPPLLPVADAAILTSRTDGTLLVGRAGLIRRPQFRTALQQLETAHARILGVVVNSVSTKLASADGYYAGDYATAPDATPQAPK
jgi:succinoglycan biosynthesis transport protein ExoP